MCHRTLLVVLMLTLGVTAPCLAQPVTNPPGPQAPDRTLGGPNGLSVDAGLNYADPALWGLGDNLGLKFFDSFVQNNFVLSTRKIGESGNIWF